MNSDYERIYALVRHIPRGRVTTYGQLGAMCGIADSRVVGDVMNASQNVPWQRVINARGEISLKGETGKRQQQLLEGEGVEFDEHGRVDFARFGWTPDPAWLMVNGYSVPPPLVKGKQADDAEQLSLL
ncbi:MAG: MGMT family protein [Chloroflexi bacterium]|nr:MGMT family protein [Chloroflexota bacterium]